MNLPLAADCAAAAGEHDTTVCAAHHLHGIHAGVIRAWGTAPHAVHRELGVRYGTAPLLAYVGDRLEEH